MTTQCVKSVDKTTTSIQDRCRLRKQMTITMPQVSTGFTRSYPQISTGAFETILNKMKFEKECKEHGVQVKVCHADNGMFFERRHGTDQSRRTTNHLLGCRGTSHEWSCWMEHAHYNNEVMNNDASLNVAMARSNRCWVVAICHSFDPPSSPWVWRDLAAPTRHSWDMSHRGEENVVLVIRQFSHNLSVYLNNTNAAKNLKLMQLSMPAPTRDRDKDVR